MTILGIKGEKNFQKIPDVLDMPHLVEIQTNSYEWFLQRDREPEKRDNQGLEAVFREIFPIEDFNKKFILEYVSYSFGTVKYNEEECKDIDITFAVPLKIRIRLINKETEEIKEQDVYMGDVPLMTERGTFIINGAERVIVSQLHRSPGTFFDYDREVDMFAAKIIPYRGAWIEFELDSGNIIYVRLDRKRRFPATVFLRALGFITDADIIKSFFQIEDAQVPTGSSKGADELIGERIAKDVINSETGEILARANSSISMELIDRMNEAGIKKIKIVSVKKLGDFEKSIINTIDEERKSKKEIGKDLDQQEEALIKIHTLLRPGDPQILENIKGEFHKMFFDPKRYNLGKVGRYRINSRLKISTALDHVVLTSEDIILTIKELVNLASGKSAVDDIDHLGNRRVRSVGELLQNQLRASLYKMERIIKEKMTVQDQDMLTPQSIINIKPLVAVINEFFGTSQLSQFLDQTNPLAELTHKRRLSALGQGGLSRERAGFEVRDVHHTHYGRVCPIETPEGPNIGLIVSLSTFAVINELGFIETPYRKVTDGKVTKEIKYLPADEEDKYKIAQANVPINSHGEFQTKQIAARYRDDFPIITPRQVDFMDVSPKQLVSVAASLIPFLEHDDANRALMGSNMQRQAVPLMKTEAPIVGTGMEHKAALDSGVVVLAKNSGVVTKVTADTIIIETAKKTGGKKGADYDEYKLLKFKRTNQNTCMNHTPIVRTGDKVKKGDIIADGPSTSGGDLALGRNVLVAFMPWEGYNFEDAIVVNERLCKEDIFTSIHIERFEIEARDTQLGKEAITRDIPNLGEEALKNLDERGIVRCGAEVNSGDILVGKVTPKGETDLTPEYKLLYSIFGEKAREVRDTSLRLPHGSEGTVIDVKMFTRENGDELPPGVEQLVKVFVAVKRKISIGDKIAGRHGNKGVISNILPAEDMPYLANGTPVDIILNPLSVPSRMNIGQILETHLGWAGHEQGIKYHTPVFDGAHEEEIRAELKKAGLPESGKVTLYDGRTGNSFDQQITIGHMYILKLAHMVDDKIHARSTGPYSLVTQQPLGGKAQFGGQRLGEMEVWALEAYGAAYALQELLTVKSDDVVGRAKVYEAIVKGETALPYGIPESFNVLVRELQGLTLDFEVLDEHGEPIDLKERTGLKREPAVREISENSSAE